MSTKKFTLPALGLVAALAGGVSFATFPTHYAAAQAAAPAPQATRPHRLPSDHVDGRIAYLKTELKITNAQQAQWDKVATAMRENAKAMDQVIEQARTARQGNENALQRLETRTRFATARAQNSERFLTAFRPLYDSLSDTQKQAANQLMTPHWHHHRR